MGIEVLEHAVSKKSFITHKVDNIDMMESDFRILDVDGKTANKGRVEIRINAIWGSISAKGMNQLAAKAICKSLSFNDGILFNANKKDSTSICDSFEGQDLCGP